MTATYKDHLALVTGANKGLGRATARRLGALGMTVLIGSRDPGRGAETVAELVEHGLDARLLVLDVTDESSVRAAATSIGRNHGRLDVLVNNAGIASPRRAPLEITADDMRLVYGTNVFGVVTVTRLMLPLLERAAHPRIVMVSSGLASLGLASLGPDSPYARYISVAYGSSKTALNAVTCSTPTRCGIGTRS